MNRMVQVIVLLNCLDINTLTIRSVVHKPNIGDDVKCKVCGEIHKVIQVGKPFTLKEKSPSN